MSRRNLFVGFWAGLAVGVVTALALSAAYAVPRVMAQPPPPGPTTSPPGGFRMRAVQRYQISAWAFPAGSAGPGGGGSAASYGAYILDTESGKVWLVKEGNKPQALEKGNKPWALEEAR
jgi:hypothetical protein